MAKYFFWMRSKTQVFPGTHVLDEEYTERERERNPKPSMQGGKLRYYRPGIQSGRGLGGVLRGIGKIASTALRGDVGPVLKSIALKTLINYGKRKAKDFVFGKLTGVKRKKKVQKESGMNGIKRRKKTAKRLSDLFTY